jgi:hypothetical protein
MEENLPQNKFQMKQACVRKCTGCLLTKCGHYAISTVSVSVLTDPEFYCFLRSNEA